MELLSLEDFSLKKYASKTYRFQNIFGHKNLSRNIDIETNSYRIRRKKILLELNKN